VNAKAKEKQLFSQIKLNAEIPPLVLMATSKKEHALKNVLLTNMLTMMNAKLVPMLIKVEFQILLKLVVHVQQQIRIMLLVQQIVLAKINFMVQIIVELLTNKIVLQPVLVPTLR